VALQWVNKSFLVFSRLIAYIIPYASSIVGEDTYLGFLSRFWFSILNIVAENHQVSLISRSIGAWQRQPVPSTAADSGKLDRFSKAQRM